MLTTASLSRRCHGLLSWRPFFASSTDHTRLLQDAEVHCLEESETKRQYVLVANGMDLEMVRKVPQLHLARLNVDCDTVFGAKVVNKTLGSISNVCPRLLDAAIVTGATRARSTLHGLSNWVLKERLPLPADDYNTTQVKLLTEICKGNLEKYDPNLWEPLARDFCELGLGEEANLYLQKEGSKLVGIEHLTDVGDFSNESGGAMAIFQFH